MPELPKQTIYDILHGVYSGLNGELAAAALARFGHLSLDQLLTDPAQMAEQNLVKKYLAAAGFKIKLVRGTQPVEPQTQPQDIAELLEGR
jgi:hypothetical protein